MVGSRCSPGRMIVWFAYILFFVLTCLAQQHRHFLLADNFACPALLHERSRHIAAKQISNLKFGADHMLFHCHPENSDIVSTGNRMANSDHRYRVITPQTRNRVGPLRVGTDRGQLPEPPPAGLLVSVLMLRYL